MPMTTRFAVRLHICVKLVLLHLSSIAIVRSADTRTSNIHTYFNVISNNRINTISNTLAAETISVARVARFSRFFHSIPCYVPLFFLILFLNWKLIFIATIRPHKICFYFHQVINKSDRPAAFDTPHSFPLPSTHTHTHTQCESMHETVFPILSKNSLPVFMWPKDWVNVRLIFYYRNWFCPPVSLIFVSPFSLWTICMQYHLL